MDKGRSIILKLTMVVFILMSITIAIIVYKVYTGFNGSFFDKLRAEGVVRSYIAEKYPDLDLEIKETYYNYKRDTFSVAVKSKTSRDTFFDVYLSTDFKVERDSYNLVEDGTTTFWRLSFAYEDEVRATFEREYHKMPAFCSAELKSDYLKEDFNHVVIKKGLELDKEYDISFFGKRAGFIDLCFVEEDLSPKKLAETFLECKAFLDARRIPFYMLSVILREKEAEKEEEPRRSIAATLRYDQIDEKTEERIKQGEMEEKR